MMAQVKRARFAFTGSPSLTGYRRPDLGGRAVSSLGRSLALRPRLATGLPWTITERWRRTSSRGTNLGPWVGGGHSPWVPVGAGVRGSCQAAPTTTVAGRRMADTMTTITPSAMRTSPRLKTLAPGSHVGRAKMSVNGQRTGSGTIALLEYTVGALLPRAAMAAAEAGM